MKSYRENHENQESGIDSRKEKLSWSEDPKRYIPRICAITITTYNWDDAIHSITYSENAQPDTNLVNRRKRSVMYMDDIKLFAKMKTNWKL